MFIAKNDIKRKVKEIIFDNVDNDVIFIVARKGVGKISLLREIYNFEDRKKDVIVADGKNVKTGIFTCLQKCYIDGIFKYLKAHNSYKMRTNFKRSLKKHSVKHSNKFLEPRKKFSIRNISLLLVELDISILKEIYVDIAKDAPLVLFINAIYLCPKDIEYISMLEGDTLKAKVTFVIAIRPTAESIKFLQDVIKVMESNVWIFPVLPEITVGSNYEKPASVASIVLTDIGDSSSYDDFKKAILSNSELFEMYDMVQNLIFSGLKPQHLFFLANQEISTTDFEYLKTISKEIYGNTIMYDKDLVIPHRGKLLWLDALSYYLIIHDSAEEAIAATQNFFFDVLLNSECFLTGKAQKNEFISFIRSITCTDGNMIASGFSKYFSDCAEVIKFFCFSYLNESSSCVSTTENIQILDRLMLEFSNTNIRALRKIYNGAQMCTILDIGLESIARYFDSMPVPAEIDEKNCQNITDFLNLCLVEAYRWLDLTLINKFVIVQKKLREKGLQILCEFKNITDKSCMYDYFVQQLNKENMEIGDVIVPKITIFLSYSHDDQRIANSLDFMLREYGYDVKRDTREIETWDSLRAFMQSIRKQDYVVLLVSDTYLHKENCIYEVIQLLKDETYKDRALPIAISFPKKNNKSMFDIIYHTEVVQYWQEYAKKLKEKIDQIDRENSAELDKKYREIRSMSQNVSEFLDSFFYEKLLATIEPDNPDISDIVNKIDSRIQEGNS